jgi:Tol biopolymer transport system component
MKTAKGILAGFFSILFVLTFLSLPKAEVASGAVYGQERPFHTRTSEAERIAFTSHRDGYAQIYVMETDGANVQQLTSYPANHWFSTWSPDGQRIAFASNQDGNAEIYVMNSDGSDQSNITNNPADDRDPEWSLTGPQIVFRSNRDGNGEIYVINADGSNARRLTNHPAEDGQPAWSPDGQKVVFVSYRDGNNEIYVMNADGSNLKRLTTDPAPDWVPAWSPDGTTIAFASQRDGNAEIYLMNADGSNQRNITWHPGDDRDPSWSPDSSRLAFQSYRDGNAEIYVMNADGSNQSNITHNPADDEQAAWEPARSVECVAPSGLDMCALQPGDILLQAGPVKPGTPGWEPYRLMIKIGGSYFTHSALYLGMIADPVHPAQVNHRIAQAGVKCEPVSCPADEVQETQLAETYWYTGESITDWAVVRPGVGQNIKDAAIRYARDKAAEDDVRFQMIPMPSRDDEHKFYCSKLVWKAYEKTGVEVSQVRGIDPAMRLAGYVTPDSLYNGSPEVQSKPGMSSKRRLLIDVWSPVHLIIVDPKGRRTGFDPATGLALSEIPDTSYSGSDAEIETIAVTGINDASGWRLTMTGYTTGVYTLQTAYLDTRTRIEAVLLMTN